MAAYQCGSSQNAQPPVEWTPWVLDDTTVRDTTVPDTTVRTARIATMLTVRIGRGIIGDGIRMRPNEVWYLPSSVIYNRRRVPLVYTQHSRSYC